MNLSLSIFFCELFNPFRIILHAVFYYNFFILNIVCSSDFITYSRCWYLELQSVFDWIWFLGSCGDVLKEIWLRKVGPLGSCGDVHGISTFFLKIFLWFLKILWFSAIHWSFGSFFVNYVVKLWFLTVFFSGEAFPRLFLVLNDYKSTCY